jgi:hypothetical protein
MKAPTGRTDFKNGGHSYKLDGQKAPGVTTIIGDGIPKPALIGWAAKSIAEYVGERIDRNGDGRLVIDDLRTIGTDPKTGNRWNKWPDDGTFSRLALIETLKGVHWLDRDRAANKGIAVHGYAEELMAGEEVEPPDELVGHVDSYIGWHTLWQPRDPILEFVCGNRKAGYMGTGDIICTLADGRRWLIDYKTNRSGPFHEVALQLAAYRYAEFIVDSDGTEQPMPPVDCCGVLWIRADGADLYEVRADETVFRTFLYVQQVARFCKADRADFISDALTLKELAA